WAQPMDSSTGLLEAFFSPGCTIASRDERFKLEDPTALVVRKLEHSRQTQNPPFLDACLDRNGMTRLTCPPRTPPKNCAKGKLVYFYTEVFHAMQYPSSAFQVILPFGV